MKFVGFCLALCLAFSLNACLDAQKVAPTQPSPDVPSASQSVTLSLPRTALAELGRTADHLLIRAFKVDKGNLGAEVRDAWRFPVTDVGLYSLEGLPLGEVEFQVALLDEKDQKLAEGNLRAIINPGDQTLPQLTLKPVKPTNVDLNLSLALKLVNFPDTPVTTPAEPEAVRGLLKTYKCQSCHNSGARPAAGLDLQSYPYKNTEGEALVPILTKVVDAMTASNGAPKMPPNNQVVKDDEVAVVRNFLQQITEASNAGNQKWVQDVRLSLTLEGKGRFETSLTLIDGVYVLSDRLNLLAGARYPYALTILGPGGSKLHEVVDGALDIPLDGRVPLQLEIIYEAPNVTLPVLVGE